MREKESKLQRAIAAGSQSSALSDSTRPADLSERAEQRKRLAELQSLFHRTHFQFLSLSEYREPRKSVVELQRRTSSEFTVRSKWNRVSLATQTKLVFGVQLHKGILVHSRHSLNQIIYKSLSLECANSLL